MVTLGGDSHKRSHTLAAVDESGRELGSRTVVASSAGHLEVLSWASQWAERRWALEDCRQLSRRLERDLLGAGELVVRVPPKLMAEARRVVRMPGKSDPIDALAVARAALREPTLPQARLEGASREVKLWLDHREDLVAERTRMQNRLRWHVHELEPEYEIPPRVLDRYCVLAELEHRVARHQGVVAELALELVKRIRQLTVRINQLERQIAALASKLTPRLLELSGCGPLSAAKVVGETAGVTRFHSPSAFAMHNGTAPIPVWSGARERHRLNRGGNRQLNAALHRIAITQLRQPGRSREYLAKRLAAGDTKTAAIRALRRRISDEVYRRLRDDEAGSGPASQKCAA